MTRLEVLPVRDITGRIHEVFGWPAESFELECLPDWDHHRVDIVRALPRQLANWSPIVACLGDDHRELVTSRDEGALPRILAAAFAEPTGADAESLARLAVMFGAWREPVGSLVRDEVPAVPGGDGLELRADPTPVLRDATVSFYCFNPETMRLYDCTMTLPGGAVEAHIQNP